MSLKSLLKRIIRSRTLNGPLRAMSRRLAATGNRSAELLTTRIPVSGEFRMQYCGQDLRYYAEGDDVVADLLYYGRNPELNELRLFTAFAQHSGTILDVGANTGLYAVLGALAAPTSSIYAFEPHPANFRRLQRNLELNGATNVKALQLAAGERSGEISFTVPADGSISMVSSPVAGFASAFYPEPPKTLSVECVTLDDFVEKQQLGRVDLVKIDVEYFEVEVLSGMRKLIAEQQPILLCEAFVYDFVVAQRPELAGKIDPHHHERMEELLREAGYHFYCVESTGLLRVDTLCHSPERSEFVSTRNRTAQHFLPYSEIEDLVGQLISK